MIDWINLLNNSLWILGLSIGLAVIGYARSEAHTNQHKLRQVLAQPGKQLWIDMAGVFFCAGLATTSQRWWEISLWVIMLALFIFQVGLAIHRRIILNRTVKNDEKG